jgi:hypothetical protein
MRKVIVVILAVLALVVGMAIPAFAATTADVIINVTPSVVAISVTPSADYDFGVQATSATPSTTTTYFTIDNTSTVQTDQTIAVTSATWEGGTYDWTHAEDGAPGASTVGLKANKGGTWGVSDVVVAYTTPLNLAENQAATTDYSYGLKMWVPTSFNASETGTEKTNTVRVSAAAG